MAPDQTTRLVACFVDFDNVLIELGKKLRGLDKPIDLGSLVVELLQLVKAKIESDGSQRIVFGRAYGTWEAAPGAANSLALMSFQPIFVLSHPRKSSADLELSLDALGVLLSRPDITEFLIVGGDRDYIPVVRRILELGRFVTIVSLQTGMSGDLKAVVGDSAFLPLEPVALERLGIDEFPPVSEHIEILTPVEPFPQEEGPSFLVPPPTGPPAPVKVTTLPEPAPTPPEATGTIVRVAIALEERESKTLDLIVKALAEKEGWEMPIVSFYRYHMNDAFPTLSDVERKTIVNNLKDKGLVDLQVKEGPYGGFTSSMGTHYLALSVNPEKDFVRERISRIFPGLTEKPVSERADESTN
jgi:hypothetical protein